MSSAREFIKVVGAIAVVAAFVGGWWWLQWDGDRRSAERRRAREEAAEVARATPIAPQDERRWREAATLALSRLRAADGFVRFPAQIGIPARWVATSNVRVICDGPDAFIGLEWGDGCESCDGGALSLVGHQRYTLGQSDAETGLPVDAPEFEQGSSASRQFGILLDDLCEQVARRLGATTR